LADKILESLKTRVTSLELVPSGGGVFEVSKDGEKIFSKKQQGRFPEWGEIRSALDAR
jgi:selenoprotein W-related protein